MSVLSGSVPNVFVKFQSFPDWFLLILGIFVTSGLIPLNLGVFRCYLVWFLQILGNFGLKPVIQQYLWTYRSVAAVLHCFLGVFEMFRSTSDVFDVINSKSWCTH